MNLSSAKLSALVNSMIEHCGSATVPQNFVLNRIDGETLKLVIDYLEHDFEHGKAGQSKYNLSSKSYTINGIIDDCKQDIKTFQKENCVNSIIGNGFYQQSGLQNIKLIAICIKIFTNCELI